MNKELNDDEESQLRAVTLQNSRSIFLARQRAEEELVRTKDALWKQSEWLRVTQASIADAVVTTDIEAKVLSLNAVAESLTGWTQQEAQGRLLDEVVRIINEGNREAVENAARRILDAGCIVGLANHTILIARDGTETPIDHSAAPIRDDEGNVRGVVLVFRSIAERKEAEKSLRQSERQLSDFFENASVGLHWVGADGTILRVNQAELDLLGFSREEYIGHHIAEFHADQDVIDDMLGRLSAGEKLQDHAARMWCKDGSIKDVLIDSSVFREDGRFVHTRCFTRDVTAQKRAETALRQSENQLRLVLDHAAVYLARYGRDRRFRFVNRSYAERFGVRPEDIVGKPMADVIGQHAYELVRQYVDVVLSGRHVEFELEVPYKVLGRRFMHCAYEPERDASGKVEGWVAVINDITERKRAEQRLTVQNGVTRSLAESATLNEAAPKILQAICDYLGWDVGALWYVDQPYRVLRCSEVWHRSSIPNLQFETSCRQSTFQPGIGLPGRVWASAGAVWIPDVVKDANFSRASAAAAEGLHGAFAFPIVLNDEVLGVIEFFSPEIRQPEEDLLQVMTAIGSQIGQFIERRRAEAALRDSEQRFRLMAETVPSVIWTAAPDGTMTYANERWSEYCGLTPEQSTRGWPEFVLHPEDHQRCVAAWKAALQQGSNYEIEVRIRRHDGAYRWFVTRAVPRRDASGSIVQWFGTATDIDDRKHAEQTTRFLADASAELAELMDYESTLQKLAALAVPHFADWCVVDIQDADGSVSQLAVSHVDPEKVQLGRELHLKYPSHPSETRGVRQVIRTGEAEWAAAIPDEMLVALTKSEDHLRLIRNLGLKSYICVPLKSRTHVLGTFTFVTAESGRVYNADDVRAAEDLAHRAVIAIENAKLLATLQESDRRKDEFLAMLAHELRNPLAPIRNAVQIFRAKGTPAPELQWATEVIDRQVHQMTRLVDDLLDVSRITRGKIELRKELVELSTVVNIAIEASRPLIEKRGHQLMLTISPQPIRLHADPTRLAQVVLNLLNNAAKYTDQGGRVWVTADQEGNRVIVRVRDNGIGIPPEMRAHIFDLFAQVDCSVERSEGGLGIGLTLVQRLVEMHGGSVAVHSDGPGKGSEFVVSLPVATDIKCDGPQGTARGDQASALVPRRMLVVDDNRDAADSLGMLLGMMGHEVHTAHDGLEAVEAAAALQPDVILLDIGLPKMNGYEVARRIREQEGDTEIVLIALTGWGQAEDRRRSKEAGFDHHLTKPVAFDALQMVIEGRRGFRS